MAKGERVATFGRATKAKKNAPKKIGAFGENRRTRKRFGSAEGIHQPVDRAVQVLVATPQRVDLIDRVENRRVVLASELAANFRKRRGGELLHQIHRDLP